MVKGSAITQDVRALWLMLRREGGWWSVSMLTHHWRPTFAPHEVQQALDALESGGFAVSRDQLTALQYCVTPECQALPSTQPVQQTTSTF